MKIIVKVQTNSKNEYFQHIKDNQYLAQVKAPAEGGKANNQLVNLIAQSFKVRWQQVIIKNPKSKKKIIEIVT